MAETQAWQVISENKRQALRDSIPVEWRVPENLLPPESQDSVISWPETSGWFTADELAITNSTVEELLPKLASGALKSETVTRAFCKRAAAAHQLTNCLSETCFDRALATAKERDDYFAKTGKPVGPLHGLPISLKDNFELKGLDATVGFVSYVGKPSAEDAALAQILEGAGAVFYVKTNVPTAMMIAETINNVFGRTLNPLSRKTTCGGSSGGEAALLALKGSPIGVGTDIGGSLRIPAACTGIFTLRPSFGRFPTRGGRSGLPGQEAVNSVNGPMARTLKDMQIYSKIVVDAQPWLVDAKCVPIPWRQVELPSKLRIGVMWNDGMVEPTPPITRALRQTVEKLRASGIEVVDWEPTDMKQALQLIGRFFSADNGQSIRAELGRSGEPYLKEMVIHENSKENTIVDMWKVQAERNAFQNSHLERWNDTGIDALLLPNKPYVTFKHSSTAHIAYTAVFNVLDYPAVSFPTGITVDKAVDQIPSDYKPLSPACNTIHDQYDVDVLDGMPISLQLVTRRLEDEKALAVTEQVLKSLS